MTDEERPTRRQADRMVVNKEFRSIEEFISEYVSDISRTGVFIRTDDPLPVGTKVDLRFTVIHHDFETVEGIGVVLADGSDEIAHGGLERPPITHARLQLGEQVYLRRSHR